jgi:hypothetical protein
MDYKRTTHIPNILFDELLTSLTGSELKILLVILRKTNGWIDQKTGKRKSRDKISYKQFQSKTGISKRSVIRAVNSLIDSNYIAATDFEGSILNAENRQGNWCIYYTSLIDSVTKVTPPGDNSDTELVTKEIPIKTNTIKLKKEKLREWENIKKIKNEISEMLNVKRDS